METSYALRVYLVENSAILLNLLTEMLQHMRGVSIVGHAASATTAISEISALVPDVVIVDIALQSGNGFDVLKTLGPGGKRPVRIVLSNYASAPYRDLAKRLGVDYFFDKGSEIHQMFKLIGSMVMTAGSNTVQIAPMRNRQAI
jgi:DNA-binding NarL/FixJ family response regulator